jgi:hypothetical protein
MKRYAAIDGCNVACGPGGKRPGDAKNIILAVNSLRDEGFDEIVIFLQQYWYSTRDGTNEIIDKTLLDPSELSEGVSLTLTPSRSDDDAIFINWAMKKNAVLVSNDGLKSHEEHFKNKGQIKEFEQWNRDYRIQFTFIAGEIALDPRFKFPKITNVEKVIKPKEKVEDKPVEKVEVKTLQVPIIPDIEDSPIEHAPNQPQQNNHNNIKEDVVESLRTNMIDKLGNNKMIHRVSFKRLVRTTFQLQANLAQLPKWNEVSEVLGFVGVNDLVDSALDGTEFSSTKHHYHNINYNADELIDTMTEYLKLKIIENDLLPWSGDLNIALQKSVETYLNSCNSGPTIFLTMKEIRSLAGFSLNMKTKNFVQTLGEIGGFVLDDNNNLTMIEIIETEDATDSEIKVSTNLEKQTEDNADSEIKVSTNLEKFSKEIKFKPVGINSLHDVLNAFENLRNENLNLREIVAELANELELPKIRIRWFVQSIFLADSQAVYITEIPSWNNIPVDSKNKKKLLAAFWENHPTVDQELVTEYFNNKNENSDKPAEDIAPDINVMRAQAWASIYQAWQDGHIVFAYFIPSRGIWCMKIKYALIGDLFLNKFEKKIKSVFSSPKLFCSIIETSSPSWATPKGDLPDTLEYEPFYSYHQGSDTICIPAKDTDSIIEKFNLNL